MPHRFHLSHTGPFQGIVRRTTQEFRTFVDEEGQPWEVCEREAPADAPWARAPRYLVFESGPIARRVWHYPAEWATLDDATLSRLKEAL